MDNILSSYMFISCKYMSYVFFKYTSTFSPSMHVATTFCHFDMLWFMFHVWFCYSIFLAPKSAGFFGGSIHSFWHLMASNFASSHEIFAINHSWNVFQLLFVASSVFMTFHANRIILVMSHVIFLAYVSIWLV